MIASSWTVLQCVAPEHTTLDTRRGTHVATFKGDALSEDAVTSTASLLNDRGESRE
jgi:hypothetical protein